MIGLSDFQHPFPLKYHAIQFQIIVPNTDEEFETKNSLVFPKITAIYKSKAYIRILCPKSYFRFSDT